MNEAAQKVLLVEDDQSIRELYAIALIKAGVNILMAQDGDQGVRLALEHHPDLILLDIDMPIMNGYDAAARIRQDDWGATVPIIFLTNRSDPRDKAHASIQMPEQFITKAEVPVREVVGIVLKAIE
jgi:DNA-binding response OmpR family regulator